MFDNNPRLTAVASFASDFRAVSAALDLAAQFIAEAACGPDAEARLMIIVEELVANLVEHGDAEAEEAITLELAALGQDIGLTLSDAGTPFDPRSVAAPADVPPERGGGAGLAFVQAWSHIVSYEPVDGRNVLVLIIPNNG
jgi:serine/threonine-protein kinase RsbW